MANGLAASPVITGTQQYKNVMFAGDGIVDSMRPYEAVPTTFKPLVDEGISTIAKGLTDSISRDYADKSYLVNCDALNGSPYFGIKKGTQTYTNLLNHILIAKNIASIQRYNSSSMYVPYLMKAFFCLHGEGDMLIGTQDYNLKLLEWQSDLQRDVFAITGQSNLIPFFIWQVSSWTNGANVEGTTLLAPKVVQDAWEVARDNPGRFYLVGPQYATEYSDGTHLTGAGSAYAGEKAAQAYKKVFFEQKRWIPLQPNRVILSSGKIVATFDVPVPPLTLDTTLVTNPGNYGFELDAGTITNVSLQSTNQVSISFTGNPTKLRYAFRGNAQSPGGPTTGPRGCLRDSDITTSNYGFKLYNWCVHFEVPIPYVAT